MKTIKIEIKETKVVYHTVEIEVDDNINEKDVRDQIELATKNSEWIDESVDTIKDIFKVTNFYECESEYCDHLEITDVYED